MRKLVLTLVLLLAFCTYSSAQQPFPGWGVVKAVGGAPASTYLLYWNGDCATAKDASSSSGSCDIVGTNISNFQTGTLLTINSTNCYSGNCAQHVDGGNRFIKWPITFPMTKGFIEYRFYVSGDPGSIYAIFEAYDTTGATYILGVKSADETMGANYYDGTGLPNNWWYDDDANPPSVISLNTGYWIQLRWDTTLGSNEFEARLCADDGTPCNTEAWDVDTDVADLPAGTFNEFILGEDRSGQASSSFDIHIDELKIWDKWSPTGEAKGF